jgi:D-aminoacyl-tRNA deacylase
MADTPPVWPWFRPSSHLPNLLMRAVVQRVKSASVTVESEVVGAIECGLVVLLGIETEDTAEDVEWLAGKLVNQRLFPSEQCAWARSVIETAGGILLVSQFTLHASTRKGTKPSWHRAARPEKATPLYEAMAARLQELLGRSIATGRFGAMMDVALVNDGPVTLLIDSKTRE